MIVSLADVLKVNNILDSLIQSLLSTRIADAELDAFRLMRIGREFIRSRETDFLVHDLIGLQDKVRGLVFQRLEQGCDILSL
jgi:hypothetical protein